MIGWSKMNKFKSSGAATAPRETPTLSGVSSRPD